MCSYKSLLPQSHSQFSQTESRTRQECAATSPYCLSPAVGTQRQSRTRQECVVTSPYCLSPVVSTKRQREELDRNVQLQVLIASVLQSVLTEWREELDRNVQLQVLIASVLNRSGTLIHRLERRTRQECAATSTYCLSPAVITQRQRVELDRNVQLQVLIASVNVVSTKRQREELDMNVQLQVLIASVLTDGEKNQIGMCSYKSLLPQSCSRYSQTERRTRQECAATSPYCLSPAVGTHRQREELDRNVQLQVLIVSALQLVLKDRDKNQIGMCSYKSLLPQQCSQY